LNEGTFVDNRTSEGYDNRCANGICDQLYVINHYGENETVVVFDIERVAGSMVGDDIDDAAISAEDLQLRFKYILALSGGIDHFDASRHFFLADLVLSHDVLNAGGAGAGADDADVVGKHMYLTQYGPINPTGNPSSDDKRLWHCSWTTDSKGEPTASNSNVDGLKQVSAECEPAPARKSSGLYGITINQG